MKFLIRKRRAAPAVIIVALIDVLIVLVIFLLVTTTFKQVPSLQLSLPTSRQPLKPGVTDDPPLIVTIAAPAATSDPGVLYWGADNMGKTIEQLQSLLAAAAAKNPNVKLAIRADAGARWQRIVQVMDAAKVANVRDIKAFTKEEGRQ